MISCGLFSVVHCLDKPHQTSISIREEPQRPKETRNERNKEKEKKR
jgi:hypothetical protein